jgi:hypothetical protein
MLSVGGLSYGTQTKGHSNYIILLSFLYVRYFLSCFILYMNITGILKNKKTKNYTVFP